MSEERKVIRQMASASSGSIVAVAQFRRFVQIWDTETTKRLSSLETTLDFGGNRLAVTRKGDLCITGSYDDSGVACYDARSGEEVWRRQDITTPQNVKVSRHGTQVYCGCEDQALFVLTLANGATDHTVKHTTDIWESPFNRLRVHESREGPFRVYSNSGKLLGQIPSKTFAALDASFGPDMFCVTESGGPVSCYDAITQRELWTHSFPKGTHALHLGYDGESGHFTAISWEYQHGGEYRGLVFDTETGAVVSEYPLPPSRYCCLSSGDRLLNSAGTLYNSINGERTGQLEFFPASEAE